ncbi:zinc metalloproteinase-disintegrin-like MTP8 [Parasteatoda tepidariorum]|uniref:zinc metalloproteinase-disintegrin-like MTP8 n=1 Tax=Parasteatoda tepidariorum TaxID=114398 RepID=UPI00077FB23D|nr:zinc metalloproteinase-disintegrin-like MTP8 [Parasteatoda tepidariorum]
MAAKFSRNVGLHAVIVLFIYWINAHTCLGFKKDPRSQFYGHAVVHPSIYTEAREKRDLHSVKVNNEEKLTIGFVAFDRNFLLDLRMNKNLLPTHYFEKHQENDSYITHLPMKYDQSHCHYQGHLKGINNSWAAISTCNGISGVIYDGNDLHYIQPDHRYDDERHLVFRASDSVPQNLTCGYSGSLDTLVTNPVFDKLKRTKRSTVLQAPYKSNEKSRFVELIIVNDNREYKEFNQDKKAVFERSKIIANIVNGLYAPLNIFIALVGVIVWSDHDEIKLSSDGDATLANFLHYRRERLAQEHPNDNAQLITSLTFDGGVVGKALKGPICTYEYSGGVNMDHSHVVGLVATTMAHELGHNFGMEHDTDEECQCPDEKCIMAPSSSSTSPRHWSSCSIEYLELAYSQGMDYCLKNLPTAVIGPVCGNGFLEEGEECDCGLKEFCDNHCCNATSCMLYENATCAMGGCCDVDTCQVRKVATPCRASISECDLPEYCDGLSEFCPSNTFRQNGGQCGNEKAYCYDGKCQSHQDQCKLLWGQTGKMSDLRCYEQNFKGNVNGNCGYNRVNQTYKACRKEDILCGMLHCSHLNEKLEFGLESAAILARSFINVKGKVFTCRSAIVDLGLFNTDPGLAPNGAKCGDGKSCVNQKCVPVNTIQKTVCPYGCSGNGVCNNRGHCHCDNGFAPPYCDSPGAGGSIDSGPASDPSKNFVVMAMYIVFLGLLPLAVLTALAIYYYRSHLKTWWSKKAHKANIKSRTKTNAQRKAQPSTKFNFDRNSLRTLEISSPIQIPPPAVPFSNHPSMPSTLPNKNVNNLCQVHISPPIPQSSTNNIPSNKFIPVRPAPPRPENAPKRVPSWTPATAVAPHAIARTASLRSPTENSAGNRPLSASTFRPSCPPPRPPPPKSPPPHQQDPSVRTYEDISRPCDTERSETPNSSFYDDCQTLDFSDTPLAFVHKPAKVGDSKDCDTAFHSQSNNVAAGRVGSVSKEKAKSNRPSMLRQGENTSKVLPRVPRTNENSVVASLAQRFEKQDASKLDYSTDIALRPPFKSRPLPPRPDNTNV